MSSQGPCCADVQAATNTFALLLMLTLLMLLVQLQHLLEGSYASIDV